MSIRLQHLREAWSYLSTFAGKAGEIVIDTTNNRMILHDGVTPGGFPAAKLSEVVTNPPSNVAAVGIGTGADPSNPLSVYGAAALFNSSASFQVKVNKAAAGNTASFLFQDGYSGRAEIGLTGDDNFHFKVSPNGSTFYDAFILTAASGLATLNYGPLSITPVTSGGAGTVNKINLFGSTYGFGVSAGSLDYVAGSAHAFYASGVQVASLTASGVAIAGKLNVKSYTVGNLPSGSVGDLAFATNARVFNGAGTLEAAGAGTGSLVVYNGAAWKIAGTNVTVAA